ncbi:MAG: substrate-binding domain-containing protein [Spirochaetota bacterium]
MSTRTTSLFQELRDTLKGRIRGGAYHAGDILPREKDLCREFSVSRVTVRKALDALKKEGLIASKKRHGTTVIYRGKKRTNMIGIVVPNSWQSLYAGIIHTMEKMLAAQNIDLMLRNGDNDPVRERAGIESILRRNADAFIFVWDKRSGKNLAVIREAVQRIPSIVIDAHIPGMTADFIASDHRTGARLAAEHLIAEGAKRLMHVRGTNGVWSADERYNGFIDACRAHHIDDKDIAVITGHFDEESATKALKRYLTGGGFIPDGVFASSDMTAYAAESVLAARGIRCPADVRIIGFGNDLAVQRNAYGLSTVDQHPEHIGKMIAKRIIDRMHAADTPAHGMTLVPTSLIVRRSSHIPGKS